MRRDFEGQLGYDADEFQLTRLREARRPAALHRPRLCWFQLTRLREARLEAESDESKGMVSTNAPA